MHHDRQQVLKNCSSIKRLGLWHAYDFSDKQYIFVPWNPCGSHWLLLTIDICKRLLYLDPMQQPFVSNSQSVCDAKAMRDHLMNDKFDVLTNLASCG